MKKITDLEYLQLNKLEKFLYKIKMFFVSIPEWFLNGCEKFGKGFVKFWVKLWNFFKEIIMLFVNGKWKTKLSYFIMGFGNIASGQYGRGILFFLFEAIFIVYMITTGGRWLGKMGTLGTQGREKVVDASGTITYVYHDNSFKILLYSLLTIFFIVAFVITWYINIKQNKVIEEIEASGKKVKSGKEDLRSIVDDKFHLTLLSLPVVGILVFTVMPIIFMILIAFTNYDKNHDGVVNLFQWVGWDNFNLLFNFGDSGIGVAFGEILSWTLIWAFFATFTNYFLGMAVAMLINKKGIKLKKLWRGILILTIAIPQFISLLYVSRLFYKNGIVSTMLMKWGWTDHLIEWWDLEANNGLLPKVMVILVNIWIGIPYLMLTTTGVLMNIPEDLYESAKIDGANVWQQYTKITLPYMLFVTGPYLLTSFVGNINNFNVIFLLTGGGPTNTDPKALTQFGTVGHTDLLITWLFKITSDKSIYYLASVIGIAIFVIISILSLIIYNVMPSNRNEEDYS